jgi:histidinol-phosphate aminotransferase
MKNLCSESQGLSRRSFLRAASATLPALAASGILSESHFAFAAGQQGAPKQPTSQLEMMKMMMASIPKDAVLINANENPLGPCEAARAAIASSANKGGRYDFFEMMKLMEVFGQQNSIPVDNIAVYGGSSEPLHYSVLSFSGPGKNLVTANPTYEAAGRAAEISGAKTIKVNLTGTYAHDVKALAAADPSAGVIYVCNPNNPTGTITSRADILWLLENKPKGTMLMVDEAYIHLSDAESMVDQTVNRKDIIVLRTFSKIYGMAGIRCGFAVAHPDVLKKLEDRGQNPMAITSCIAGRVSLEDTNLIPERKAYIGQARTETIDFLVKNGYKVIPGSQSNCFMIDTGRNGRQVMAAMAKKKVIIGRTWPIWPNTVRITVGTKEEMAKFRVAYKEVMDAPATASLVHPEITHIPQLS